MCMLVPDESRASHIGWCAGHSALIAFCIVSILLIDVGCCTQTGPTAGRNVMAPLNSTEQAVLVSEDIIKPRCDKLGYRSITLPNKLRVLLISDPDTDKAAAALNVRVGSMCDPVELPGLAHFCEHMLFYSSAKYPVEDEYSK
eukprot:GHUV01008644.1.p2 GENE.GHUV01008644.1~~GHUV01008644.1.p2  ORF type:complete len:143 (+),score=36.70 GHUV01008644.1:87-515(+)